MATPKDENRASVYGTAQKEFKQAAKSPQRPSDCDVDGI
jgi:hypothetical protein